MQKCSSCGTDLPEYARFCRVCGNMQKPVATDAVATRNATPEPQSWMPEGGTIEATWSPFISDPAQGNAPAWSPIAQGPETPPPTSVAENEDEEERRGGIPPWSPLYGAALGGEALLGSGQISTPGAPMVQGTPQIGNVPGVAGSPSPYTNAPVTHPMQGAANAPVSHPVQGPGNAAPVSHPVPGPTNAPISHPVPGPTSAPISHPVPGPVNAPHPQPRPQPPEKPEPPPTHKHHRHHDHPDEHEHHQHQTHPAHHELHQVTRVAKVGGGSTVKTIILVVTAAAVVAAGGIAAAVHFLARPQPLISITSNFKVGNILAGATGTTLHISGQQFASNAAITFLLDGGVAPGNPGTRSDTSGNFSTNMTITSAWSVGTHTLTARDASNDSTKSGVSVTVVQPGQANTPGPDGAPPDDASFKVVAHIQGSQSTETEVVTGHPDPLGGTVCQTEDNGQPFVRTGVTTGIAASYRETSTFSCAGSYKGGKLTLTETLRSDVRVYSEPDGTTKTCTLNAPQPPVDEQVSGSYTGNNTFSGTITYPTIPDSNYSCIGGSTYTVTNFYQYNQVNWTGQVTDLHS